MVISAFERYDKGEMQRLIPAAMAITTVLMFTGCLSFFQTDVNINGDGDYVTRIGKSKTTTIEAMLSSGGEYRISYAYIDSHWLLAEKLIIDTDCCIIQLDFPEPVRVDNGKGAVIETDTIKVRRNLLEQILESANPVISLQGEQGTVIIEIGYESKQNLKELLDYGIKEFPEI
ncbi:MAG: hypothetical protein DRP70_06035 [Spirochaetes bacterium]|nr:MAG: hypothetical protein DRP70_06035 [Spirochaetota bacterium]RKX97424.1 MAG: hypothetical protein DRZ90_06300 [Spirochaetota bacterium]